MSLAPLAERIPMPALAGLLIFTAVDMMNWRRVALVWRTARTSRTVFLTTFVATLLLPLEYSIYLGAFLSIMNYLQASSHPQITQLVPANGSFREVPLPAKVPSHYPILISVTGYLHFAAIHDIEKRLTALSEIDRPIIILRMRATSLLGSTAISFLEAMLKLIQEHNGALILCGVEPGVAKTLDRSGLLDKLGHENLFYASDMLLESTREALERAREIQRQMEGVDEEAEEETEPDRAV
ncbi:MAG: STAS domain-containing protein [Anaerolineae bacterium]|nr:STAS domain-containing protein [Anaerolineae bacterium]